MGRRKLEIKRIQDNNARQMTFTKRRQGLLKKARELSVLCDVDVAAIIFSSRGKHYHYCSGNNLSGIMQRYQSHVEIEEGGSKEISGSQEQYPKDTGWLSSGELLQFVERELGEACLNQLSVTDLVLLEKQLEHALILTRSTKTNLLLDSISSLHEKEKVLAGEKKDLEEKLAESKRNGTKNKVMMMDLNVIAECQDMEQ